MWLMLVGEQVSCQWEIFVDDRKRSAREAMTKVYYTTAAVSLPTSSSQPPGTYTLHILSFVTGR
jgi:hypothetical protein